MVDLRLKLSRIFSGLFLQRSWGMRIKREPTLLHVLWINFMNTSKGFSVFKRNQFELPVLKYKKAIVD